MCDDVSQNESPLDCQSDTRCMNCDSYDCPCKCAVLLTCALCDFEGREGVPGYLNCFKCGHHVALCADCMIHNWYATRDMCISCIFDTAKVVK